MANAKSTAKVVKLSPSDLNYLAGIYEATLNLRGVNSTYPVAISNTEDWVAYLAQTFGGSHAEFTASSGKNYWGWYVGLELRLELLEALEKGKVFLRSLSGTDIDGIRGKLTKSLNSRANR